MADPSSDLAKLLKGAKSGKLRGIAAKAMGALADGDAAFDDLGGVLKTYTAAVDDAKALAAFVRGELQAAGANEPPDITLKNSSEDLPFRSEG